MRRSTANAHVCSFCDSLRFNGDGSSSVNLGSACSRSCMSSKPDKTHPFSSLHQAPDSRICSTATLRCHQARCKCTQEEQLTTCIPWRACEDLLHAHTTCHCSGWLGFFFFFFFREKVTPGLGAPTAGIQPRHLVLQKGCTPGNWSYPELPYWTPTRDGLTFTNTTLPQNAAYAQQEYVAAVGMSAEGPRVMMHRHRLKTQRALSTESHVLSRSSGYFRVATSSSTLPTRSLGKARTRYCTGGADGKAESGALQVHRGTVGQWVPQAKERSQVPSHGHHSCVSLL